MVSASGLKRVDSTATPGLGAHVWSLYSPCLGWKLMATHLSRAASGLTQGRDLSTRPQWFGSEGLDTPTRCLCLQVGDKASPETPGLSCRRWTSVAEPGRASLGLALRQCPRRQGRAGRGEGSRREVREGETPHAGHIHHQQSQSLQPLDAG